MPGQLMTDEEIADSIGVLQRWADDEGAESRMCNNVSILRLVLMHRLCLELEAINNNLEALRRGDRS